MRKIHLLMPTILVASSMPMVSMVGCNDKKPEPEVVHVTGVEIAQESKNINIWKEDIEHQKIKYTVFPDNATDKSVRWSGYDTSIAYIADDGTITPRKVGETRITISTKDGGFTDYCDLKVQNVGSISITQGDTIAYLEHPRQLTYELASTNSVEAISVTWESSNTDVATIDNNGWITPKAVGDTTITVKIENTDISDQCILTILEPEPLCFTNVAEAGVTSSVSFSASDLPNIHIQCSSDPKNGWEDWNGSPKELGDGQSIYVRNTNNTLSESQSRDFEFSMEGIIQASGSVDSMINYSELTPFCYCNMFFRCESLVAAPELPATTLVEDCYEDMFVECTSLTKAPELPATTLAAYCYWDMFEYCTSLKQAPSVLPATVLTDTCYCCMFDGCTSLTAGPKLPAAELAKDCYNSMFDDCTNLKIRQKDIYEEDEGFIFTCPNECPEGAVSDMFNGISSKSEFKGNPQPGKSYYWYIDQTEKPLTFTATDDFYVTIGRSGTTETTPNLKYSINGGVWTNYDMAELPTISVEAGFKISFCGNNPSGFNHYDGSVGTNYYTFNIDDDDNCCSISGNIMSLISEDNFKALTEIPCDGCFYSLFDFCDISDSSDMVLPATQLTQYCYDSMFDDCENLIYSPKVLPATELKDYCYHYMFSDCDNLTTAPRLLATKLANSCCERMFDWCEKLNIREEPNNSKNEEFIFTCPDYESFRYPVALMFNYCHGFGGTPTPGYSYYWYTNEAEPLTFTATAGCDFYLYPEISTSETWEDPNLEYSVNGGSWQIYDYNVVGEENPIHFNSGDVVRFRGDNPNGFNHCDASGNNYYCYDFWFYNSSSSDKMCGTISGNVMSLLSKENFASLTAIPCIGCFYCLFYESYYISDAANLVLPAMQLTPWCYAWMFEDDEDLKCPPKILPATILKEGCYYEMFESCYHLTFAPEILAASIEGDCCCYEMFYDCYDLNIREVEWAFNGVGFVLKCPQYDTREYGSAFDRMFLYTGGSFTGNPTPGYTYYWYTE